jgi:hypothetical protein
VAIARVDDKCQFSISQRYPTFFSTCRGSRKETSSILGGKLIDLDKHVSAYYDAKRDSIVLRVCRSGFEVGDEVTKWKGLEVEVWNHGRIHKSREPIYMLVSRGDRVAHITRIMRM